MSDVQLFIYDISRGMFKHVGIFLGKNFNGIWHTAIVAFEKEWFFGQGGVVSCTIVTLNFQNNYF
jgi:desumoylating isopeptidase 1